MLPVYFSASLVILCGSLHTEQINSLAQMKFLLNRTSTYASTFIRLHNKPEQHAWQCIYIIPMMPFHHWLLRIVFWYCRFSFIYSPLQGLKLLVSSTKTFCWGWLRRGIRKDNKIFDHWPGCCCRIGWFFNTARLYALRMLLFFLLLPIIFVASILSLTVDRPSKDKSPKVIHLDVHKFGVFRKMTTERFRIFPSTGWLLFPRRFMDSFW
jgi:hypothetical protein